MKGFMRGEEYAEGHEERSSPSVTSPKKIRVVDKKMVMIARRAYDGKISNPTLHPSTALISPLMLS
jgi:hypothetical protein